MHGVEYRLEIVAPLVHLSVDLCGSVGVGLTVVDRLVAKFDDQAFDFSVANEKLQKH